MANYNPYGSASGFLVNDRSKYEEWVPTMAINDLIGMLVSQEHDAYAGQDNVRGARNAMTALGSAGGRAARIESFGNQQQAQAMKNMGRIQQAMMAAGLGNQKGAAQLGAINQASKNTNQYAQQLESPESLSSIYRGIGAINSPDSIMSIIPMLLQLEQARRGQAQVNDAKYQSKGFWGDLLGTVVGGLSGGGLSFLRPGGGGGGGSDASGRQLA